MGFSFRRLRYTRSGDGMSMKSGGAPCMKEGRRWAEDFAKESRCSTRTASGSKGHRSLRTISPPCVA